MKIFAFFGQQLERRDQASLAEHVREGFTLLPLDSDAVRVAVEAGQPYALCEDFVDAESRLRAVQLAREASRSWFDSARDEFTVDGICWPEFDQFFMKWFWEEVMLAKALSKVFVEIGGTELKFFGAPRRPSAAWLWHTTGTCSTLWAASLGNRATTLRCSSPPEQSFWRRAFDYGMRKIQSSGYAAAMEVLWRVKRRSGAHQDEVRPVPPSSLEGSIVLVMNSEESLRFAHIIDDLSKSFPGRVSVMLRDPDSHGDAWKISKRLSVKVAFPPRFVKPDRDLGIRFVRAYQKAKAASSGKPWHEALSRLGYHFEHYCRSRWPLMARYHRYWANLWQNSPPAAVLATTIWESSVLLPSHVARDMGIPTFAIPHGGAAPTADTIITSEYCLHGHSNQRDCFIRAGIPLERTIACRGLLAEHEYPVASDFRAEVSAKSSLRILVLTDPTGQANCLAKAVGLRAQLHGLKALNSPPSDIADKCTMKVKVHPKFSDLGIMAAAGDSLRKKVLPTNSDLHSVLKESDVVVALNYVGTALIHVLCSGKPVICFITESDPLLKRTDIDFRRFLPGATLVRTSEEFWGVIKSFMDSPELVRKASEKSLEFCRRQLNDSGFPSIGEALDPFVNHTRCAREI